MAHITYKGTEYDLNALVDLLDQNKALYDEIGNTVEYDSPEDDLLSSAIQALVNRTLTQETSLSNSNATINKVHASFSEALTKIADGKEASIRAGKKPHNYTIILDRNGKALVSKNGFLAFLHVMFCGAKYDGGKVALKKYLNHSDSDNRLNHMKTLMGPTSSFQGPALMREIKAAKSDHEFMVAKLGASHSISQAQAALITKAEKHHKGGLLIESFQANEDLKAAILEEQAENKQAIPNTTKLEELQKRQTALRAIIAATPLPEGSRDSAALDGRASPTAVVEASERLEGHSILPKDAQLTLPGAIIAHEE